MVTGSGVAEILRNAAPIVASRWVLGDRNVYAGLKAHTSQAALGYPDHAADRQFSAFSAPVTYASLPRRVLRCS